MWKLLLIILTTALTMCEAENEVVSNVGRGKYPYKHHHHHGLYYLSHYWVFLAIKAKIIFLIGTFISFWVFAGKMFAFLYYYKGKDRCNCPQYHSEKIVVPETPHFEHKYSTINNLVPFEDYSKPPKNVFQYNHKPYWVSDYERYSRSIKTPLHENIDDIKTVFQKIDVTELAFNAMNLKEGSCRRRFVCEANIMTRKHPLIAVALYVFSDVGLTKYKVNNTINSVKDCAYLGPKCTIAKL